MEILELLETFRTEEATIKRLFGGEGKGVHSLQKSATYQSKLVETAQFVADILEGRRPVHHLREAMTTSDFPLLFGDVLDRQVLANYREWPSVWATYCNRSTVPDFRWVTRFNISGAEAVLAEVPQQTIYPSSKLDEAADEYRVLKYGRRLPFSWETMINDDLQALQDVPRRFGRASRRSEDKYATQLHVDANGPHASIYTGGNSNIITANPVLAIAALQLAMTVLAAHVDSDGEPIMIDATILEVPPSLEVVARNILNAIEITILTGGGGDAVQGLRAVNWMKNRVTLAVNPYIPIVASSTNGTTTWFLHASPSNGRPAFEMGFLRGHTEPEIFVKDPNARRVGGGGVNPMDGDFDTDSIEYKIRHVFGGAALDPIMTVGSNGSGS